ncbi:MAG: hypothetical protein RIQ60_327 [Pseudomonadota bacterium]|jgi:hypothetical protein
MNPLPSPEAARLLVLHNARDSELYAEASFMDRLFEDAVFDASTCDAFVAALRVLVDHPALAADTDRYIYAISRLLAVKLLCHLNPNDGCWVSNLDDDAAIDLKNHLDSAVGSYFFRLPFELPEIGDVPIYTSAT